MDVNTKALKKNAFRVTKERGMTASRVRVPGGHMDAYLLGLVQESQKSTAMGRYILPADRALKFRAFLTNGWMKSIENCSRS